MYIIGANVDYVNQFNLSTPWDIYTASYDSINFLIVNEDGASTDLFFNASGNKMYILGTSVDHVHQYTLQQNVTDSTAPTFSSPANDTGIQKNQNITMNITIADNIELSSYIFSWNDTGSWANNSAVSISGSPYSATTSESITANSGTVVSWRYYANDTSGNKAASGLYNFTVAATPADTSAPSFSGSVNNTLFKRYFNASMNLTITDDTDISNYTFSWNESGSFVNDTSVQLAGTQTTWFMNTSRNVTNALYNQIVQWRVYSCDSSNNCNTSAAENMTIANTLPISINQSYIIQSTYSSTLRIFFNSSWNDVDQDNATLTVKLESNYTGTPANYTANNITKGIYNYSAILPAGTHTRRWCTTDSASAVNCTDLETFVISKAASNITLLLDNSAANISITTGANVNITVNLTTGIGFVELYNAGTFIANSSRFPYSNLSTFSSAGSFNITAFIFSNENVTYNFTALYVTATAPAAETPTGGGGGGGGGEPSPKELISVNQNELNIKLEKGEITSEKITVKNSGDSAALISLDSNLDFIRFDEASFFLEPGEEREITAGITAPKEPGIYTGKIRVNGISSTIPIFLSFNVRSQDVLFDASIKLADTSKKVSMGEPVSAQINLIKMTPSEGLDVTLHYFIKDFEGETLFKESETFYIDKEKTLIKEFPTLELATG